MGYPPCLGKSRRRQKLTILEMGQSRRMRWRRGLKKPNTNSNPRRRVPKETGKDAKEGSEKEVGEKKKNLKKLKVGSPEKVETRTEKKKKKNSSEDEKTAVSEENTTVDDKTKGSPKKNNKEEARKVEKEAGAEEGKETDEKESIVRTGRGKGTDKEERETR